MRRNDDRNRGAAGGGRWSRRGVLRQVGGLVAATAFAPGFSHSLSAQQGEAPAPKSDGSLSKEMEAFSVSMGGAACRELPPPVLQKAKFHVLDTFAAMISGLELDPGRAAIRFATAYGGQGVATIVASKLKAGPIEAALANGVLAHADETDDSHAPATWHPGCAVVPAAFAVGGQFSICGSRSAASCRRAASLRAHAATGGHDRNESTPRRPGRHGSLAKQTARDVAELRRDGRILST